MENLTENQIDNIEDGKIHYQNIKKLENEIRDLKQMMNNKGLLCLYHTYNPAQKLQLNKKEGLGLEIENLIQERINKLEDDFNYQLLKIGQLI